MLEHPVSRTLAIYLVAALLFITLPVQGWAMFLPSADRAGLRSEELAKVQALLESRIVRARLMDYGLTSDEALSKLKTLSDEQVHELVSNLEAMQPGGDGLGGVIFLLLVAVVVVAVLKATGHEIIIKR